MVIYCVDALGRFQIDIQLYIITLHVDRCTGLGCETTVQNVHISGPMGQ